MALVSSSLPTVLNSDPTTVLKAAIAKFEEALTGDQRLQLHGAATNPQPVDVIAFVSQIDANSHFRARRCIASRLSHFLDAAKQFIGVVDTFSSGSQIAALIWGSLKFTITAASNALSYFEKVTDMIMSISRSTPVYSQFGQLYPSSVGLQHALCEYYATIVRLCTKIVEVAQRAGIAHTVRSMMVPFEAEFKEYRDQLDQDVKQVQMHISLASKEESQSENTANQRHRRLAAIFRSEARTDNEEARKWRLQKSNHQKEKLKSAIMKDLSTQNYFQTWNHFYQQKAPSTAEWLYRDSVFSKWKDEPTSTILWCSGTLGIGKTILMSSVIAHLQQNAAPKDHVCYHFCRSEDQTSLDVRTILGTIIRQMIEVEVGYLNVDDLRQLRSRTRDLVEAAALTEVVVPLLKHDQTYYIILDGLDEMQSADISLLVECISRFSKECVIKVIYAGRPELEACLFRQVVYNHKITITRSRTKQDVDQFATTELIKCLDEGLLRIVNPAIILKIVEDLRCESEEMFLWTRLFIEEMCAQQNENDILRVLQDCPRKLSLLLDRKMERLQKHDAGKQAMKILKYCSVLRRPLTIGEYRELLSIKPKQQAFDRGEIPTDIGRVVVACCGLVFIDEQEETLHYVHQSVRRYLLKNLRLDRCSEIEMDICLGEMCLTYLNFKDFERQVTKYNAKSTAAIQPIQLGITPLLSHSSNERVSGFAQYLLRRQRELKSLKLDDLEQKSQELINDPRMSGYSKELQGQDQQYLFLDYARTQWLHHFRDMSAQHQCREWQMFCLSVSDDTFHSVKPWSEYMAPQRTALQENWKVNRKFEWAMIHGHYGVLLYLLLTKRNAITEEMILKVFASKAFSLSLRSVSMIVTHADCSQETLDLGLRQAATVGDVEVVAFFISVGANVNAPRITSSSSIAAGIWPWYDIQHWTSVISCAARAGHDEVVEHLLAAGAKVDDPDDPDTWGMTALSHAAQGGHLQVVQRLLAAGANCDSPDTTGLSAISYAAEHGHLHVVQRLLAAGASVEGSIATKPAGSSIDPSTPEVTSRQLNSWTPLFSAARGGHCEIVDELLAAGANVDASNSVSSTALSYATQHGHLDVVKRLLAAGANINNVSDAIGWTALSKAAENGHLEIVEQLLIGGVEVNASTVDGTGTGWPAICAAAGSGHLEVVDRLLAAGATVDTQSIAGLTPLFYATQHGHVEVVKRLLPLTAPSDKDVRKLLKAASQYHHPAVMRTLEEFRARK